MTAAIFDIQRSSFVDGPGIRTTVFMKGCNLHCKWCHNPESQSARVQMMIYRDKCIGCGKCIDVCPRGQKSCDLCGRCALFCPSDARKIVGKTYDAESLYCEIVKDKAFFDSSGGGVTFSGGECMLQIDFLCEILKLCRDTGIHTAVDTAGNVPWEYFERVMPYTNLFLYDIKAYTDALHKEGTGASNALILENLERLSVHFGGRIIVRVPIIAPFNANDSEISRIAELTKRLGLKEVELLPYHRMGAHKYAALGMEAESFNVPSDDDMARWRRMFV